MNERDLQDLRSRLEGLGEALDAGDLPRADQVATGYDGALRRYVENCSPASIPSLQELLRIQNALLARMQDQHADTGGQLRRMHQAGAASRAYTAAGPAQ